MSSISVSLARLWALWGSGICSHLEPKDLAQSRCSEPFSWINIKRWMRGVISDSFLKKKKKKDFINALNLCKCDFWFSQWHCKFSLLTFGIFNFGVCYYILESFTRLFICTVSTYVETLWSPWLYKNHWFFSSFFSTCCVYAFILTHFECECSLLVSHLAVGGGSSLD